MCENTEDKDLTNYYHSQAGQKKYLDALLKLVKPSQHDVILDIGTGSGTVSFFLGDRVKKIYAIDPNQTYIEKNRIRADKIVETREVLPSFNVNFQVMAAEDIEVHFPATYFDTIVCWGSVHHFSDYAKAMKGISQTCKPGGKLIIFDAFFPEAIRDFWEMVSTIHDPTTVRHHTYFEYMEMLRQNGFIPETILPFRHRNMLNKWLSTINRMDEVVTEEIKAIHPGKYNAWLEKARQKGLKETLKQEILSLDDVKKAYISIRDLGDGNYEFTYDTFVLLATKERRATK